MNARRKAADPEAGPAAGADSLAPAALYLRVAERLRGLIFAHQLAPGSWVDEQALASRYGISRTPLREALKVLASEGLVTLRPRRGCYVAEVDERDLDEIYPLLALLEGEAAALAARRLGAAELRRLEALHAELERATAEGNVGRIFEVNQHFHTLVQEQAGSRRLVQVIADLRRVLQLTRHNSLLTPGRPQGSLLEHRRIMVALRDRSPQAAREAMHAHLLAGRAAAGGTPERRTAQPAG
jgi:DNA-binding GntR family transcriptional regulator